MRRFEHLADLEAFHRSVELGSFSAAAQAMGATPSAISRAVERLERAVGQGLLRRSTRRLALTDAGQAYLDATRAALALIDESERGLQGAASTIAGRLRLSVPSTWAHHWGLARLARFADQHPGVELDVAITSRNVDLVAEGFDAAVRLGPLPDSGLVARAVLRASLCLVASPEYLQARGHPRSLDDLARHRCLPFVRPSTGRVLPWSFRVDGQTVEWSAPGRVRTSDDVLGCVTLAEAGAGVTQTYDFIVAERIARGRLVEVLPALRGRARTFWLVHAPVRQLPRALRALIDALADPGG
jgi:DNA-binding transcriptional LysR family regulator